MNDKTLDEQTIVRLPVDAIVGHPDNTYDMGKRGIEELADNVLTNGGLTDIPLARELDDGTIQMLSGHRRLAAYRLLSITHPDYAEIPVRVIHNITDAQALAILHSANLYTRTISPKERRRQAAVLIEEISAMRGGVPEWKGQRASKIVAELLGVGKTSLYNDRTIEMKCSTRVKDLYDRGEISRNTALMLSKFSGEQQNEALSALDGASETTAVSNNAFLKSYFSDGASKVAAAKKLIDTLTRVKKTTGRVPNTDLVRRCIDRVSAIEGGM